MPASLTWLVKVNHNVLRVTVGGDGGWADHSPRQQVVRQRHTPNVSQSTMPSMPPISTPSTALCHSLGATGTAATAPSPTITRNAARLTIGAPLISRQIRATRLAAMTRRAITRARGWMVMLSRVWSYTREFIVENVSKLVLCGEFSSACSGLADRESRC